MKKTTRRTAVPSSRAVASELKRLGRPLLRWAGSKRQLVPVLLNTVPKGYKRYVEPFAGSAALFFALQPASALIADTNCELINFYKVFRRKPTEVLQVVANTPKTKRAYYSLREVSPDSLSSVDRASRFFLLNRLCFNGVYRLNKLGHFNVPMGSKIPPLPQSQDLLRYAYLLRQARIQCSDFSETIASCGEGDFVYADPPYYGARHRGEYGIHQFSDKDLDRLVVALKGAAKRGARVALSYADSNGLRQRMSGWYEHRVAIRRTVAASTASRAPGFEMLFTSFKTARSC